MTGYTAFFRKRTIVLAYLGIAVALVSPWSEAKNRSTGAGRTVAVEKSEGQAPVVMQADQSLSELPVADNATGGRKFRNVTIPFRKLGALSPLGLRGVQGSMALPFSIRSDEVVVGAHLSIEYNYSPSLLPELSHIQVMLNEEVVSVIPLPKEKNLDNRREIDIDPRLFSDFNRLTFRLIGHYTYSCEDPLHSSLWANISHKGNLKLKLAPLSLVNDLKILPVPFFDRRDENRLDLPFVFSRDPGLGTLRAAGVVSSWFGGLAGYRGAQFPAIMDSLPNGNAVVFIAGSTAPASFSSMEINGPMLAIEPHPSNPNAKLLIVAGRNENELMTAARTLVLNDASLSGQRVLVTKDAEPAPRKPYDAPAWVPTDRPVRFAELAKNEELRVRGYFPDMVKIKFRVSPDLFSWYSLGVPLDLKYRYTRLPFTKNSSLNVGVSEGFIHAISLGGDSAGARSDSDKPRQSDKVKLSTLGSDLAVGEEKLFIPPSRLGSRNQLQLQYHFEIIKDGECRDSLPDNLQGTIDPESTLDFSAFPHYAALPNLAFFANLGFPFTRYADLAETSVVVPETPSLPEISTYLAVMGKMGESTGYPALRHSLISPAETDRMTNRDLIVIGSSQRQSLFGRWADRLPLIGSDGERRLRTPDVLRNLIYRWEEKDLQAIPRSSGQVNLAGGGDIAALMGIESPISSKRSVVAIYADKDGDLLRVVDALNNGEKASLVQGDFVIINHDMPEHFRVGETYYVGDLPFWIHLRWIMTKHPILTGLLVLLAALVLATVMYRTLRQIAAKRLEKQG